MQNFDVMNDFLYRICFWTILFQMGGKKGLKKRIKSWSSPNSLDIQSDKQPSIAGQTSTSLLTSSQGSFLSQVPQYQGPSYSPPPPQHYLNSPAF